MYWKQLKVAAIVTMKVEPIITCYDTEDIRCLWEFRYSEKQEALRSPREMRPLSKTAKVENKRISTRQKCKTKILTNSPEI